MRISAKGEYAIKAMLDLALERDRGLIPIQEIAARRGIPQRYLEQVLLSLVEPSESGRPDEEELPRSALEGWREPEAQRQCDREHRSGERGHEEPRCTRRGPHPMRRSS